MGWFDGAVRGFTKALRDGEDVIGIICETGKGAAKGATTEAVLTGVGLKSKEDKDNDSNSGSDTTDM